MISTDHTGGGVVGDSLMVNQNGISAACPDRGVCVRPSEARLPSLICCTAKILIVVGVAFVCVLRRPCGYMWRCTTLQWYENMKHYDYEVVR